MSRYRGEHRAPFHSLKANRLTANRMTVRHACWMDVSDFLLSIPTPKPGNHNHGDVIAVSKTIITTGALP